MKPIMKVPSCCHDRLFALGFARCQRAPASSTKLHAPSASGLGTSAGRGRYFYPACNFPHSLPRAAMLTLNDNILPNDCILQMRTCFRSLSVLINCKRTHKRFYMEEHVKLNIYFPIADLDLLRNGFMWGFSLSPRSFRAEASEWQYLSEPRLQKGAL